MYVDVGSGDYHCSTVMIDSGASHNFVNSELINELGIKTEAGAIMVVTLANGQTVQSDQVAKIPVKFSSCFECTMECRVVNGLSHPLVLGMSWLRMYNSKINWVESTM